MTLDEALATVERYTPRERSTHDKIHSAYLTVRERLKGSTARVTRELVRVEYGGRSTGTVSKYLSPIEVIETAKLKAISDAVDPNPARSTQRLPKGVQEKLDALRGAVDAVATAMGDAILTRDAEFAESHQRQLDDQKAFYQSKLDSAEAGMADLESASQAAGQEAEALGWQVDDLRAELCASQVEVETATAEAKAAARDKEMSQIRLVAAEAQIETLQMANKTLATEVANLTAEPTNRAELVAENVRLRERAAILENQVARLENLIVQTDRRHADERAALRRSYQQQIVDERRRAADREA